jgi:hypothetical protein
LITALGALKKGEKNILSEENSAGSAPEKKLTPVAAKSVSSFRESSSGIIK